jgi:hypothetical protein
LSRKPEKYLALIATQKEPAEPSRHPSQTAAHILEHFHQFCSQAGEEKRQAVFLIFGFVSAQSQAAAGMLLRQSLAKKPKTLAPHGCSISSNALINRLRHGDMMRCAFAKAAPASNGSPFDHNSRRIWQRGTSPTRPTMRSLKIKISQTAGPRCCVAIIPGGAAAAPCHFTDFPRELASDSRAQFREQTEIVNFFVAQGIRKASTILHKNRVYICP